METIKEFLYPGSFNHLSFAVVICSVGIGIILFGVVYNMENNEQKRFSCQIQGEEKEFLQKTCFTDYQAKTTRGFPLYAFVLLNFLLVIAVCFFYSQSVRSKVKDLERQDPEIQANQSSRGLYRRYCIQLAIRFILGMTFLVLQWVVFYPIKFPSEYTCDLSNIHQEKHTNIPSGGGGNITRSCYDCHNQQAPKKTILVIVVFVINFLSAVLILYELMYVLRKGRTHSFRKDFDFFSIHLQNNANAIQNHKARIKQNIKQETKFHKLLIPGEERKSLELDKIYTNLIVYPGRIEHDFTGKRHEIIEGYVTSRQRHPSIDNVEAIFTPTSENSHQRPLSIMIIGRPGIGKSLLCLKILRDWACGEIFNEETEAGVCFEVVYLLKFRHFNSDEKLNLQQLLERGQFSGAILNEIYSWILSHPEKVLLIFDGLDEFGKKENIRKEEKFGSKLAETIPFSALYSKLTLGKVLKGATVVTTSRSTALSYVSFQNEPFARTLEILGFNSDKTQECVKKFCQLKRILSHISSNRNLLSLCYIPVNCHILCFSLLKRIKQDAEDTAVGYLPTTLTEIYEDALMIVVCKHHPQYRCNVPEQKRLLFSRGFSPEVETTLKRLGKIAYEGIKEDRRIFESDEVEDHEECGLLHRLPDKRVDVIRCKEQYCFLHLTIQELLAARYIVALLVKGNSEAKLMSWISEHLHEGKWEVVIQFVAGLARDKHPSHPIITSFVKSLPLQCTDGGRWPVRVRKGLVISLFKCIFENSRNSKNKWKSIAEALTGIVYVDMSSASVTDADLTSIMCVLQAMKSMESIDVSLNHITPIGCLEITKLLKMSRDLESFSTNDCELTTLNIRHKSIDDDGLMHLSDALATNECKLTKLDISRNQIDDDGVKHLSDALATNECKLTTLNISWNEIGDGGLKHLSHALATNECKLTTLNISHNQIGDGGLKHLSDALATNECKLTTLDINVNQIGDGGLKHLSNALATNECKLTTLNITLIQIGDGGLRHPSNALAANECKLTTLNISHNQIGDGGLKHLSNALATTECKLTTLEINGNQIGDGGLKHLSDALATNECKLTTLNMRDNQIGDGGLKHLSNALATNECKLTTLNMRDNQIGDGGLKHLSNALATNECKLTTVDIRDNEIGDGGLKHLSNALATNECKLTTLNITLIQIGDGGLRHPSNAVAANECKLTTLDISDNQIGDGGLKHLSEALATNECKLTTLDISDNQIGDGGLKHLSEALATNECKLTTLDISDNRVGDGGLKYLSNALARNECKLTTLNISCNQIGDDGLKHLSNTLATNECKLSTLNISRNQIGDDGLKHLSNTLATNECKVTTLDCLKQISDVVFIKRGGVFYQVQKHEA